MELYQAGDKWVLGVGGGCFDDFEKKPEAIILDNKPTPIRICETKSFIGLVGEKEPMEVQYVFSEYQGDNNSRIFFLNINFSSYSGYSEGSPIEFFVSEDFAEEKINFLKKHNCIAEFIWDPSSEIFKGVSRGFKFEDEEDDDEIESRICKTFKIKNFDTSLFDLELEKF